MHRPACIDAKRILVVRTDRLGDLILSTPLLRSIKAASPEAKIAVLAPPHLLPTLQGNPDVERVLGWDPHGKDRRTARTIANEKYDAAILLNPGFRAGLLGLRAGIPYRTGPISRLPSLLFLNRGLRQKRSRSRRHQSELDAEFAGLVTGGRADGTPTPTLYLNEDERQRGKEVLKEAGIGRERPVVGIHAGSGDSAVRWPEERYAALGRLYAKEGWSVAFTGSAKETAIAGRLARAVGRSARSVAGDQSLRTFFGLLASLDLFVASSTGPLHAAAALGVPVSAPYPPLPSQAQRRWGPLSPRAAIVAPPVECPARIRCRGPRCPHHPCMEQIKAEDLYQASRPLFPAERISV